MHNNYGFVLLLIGIAFLLVAVAIPLVLHARAESQKELRPLLPFTAPNAALALREFEEAAPHLFQLRAVGVAFPLSYKLRQALLTADAIRGKKIIDLIDGNVVQ